MPIILATQKAEIGRITVQSQPRQITLHKKGLVEWLMVKALSSNPSTTNIYIYIYFKYFNMINIQNI
jgi:hypothetical protein